MRLICLRPLFCWLLFLAVSDSHQINDTFKVYRVFPVVSEHIQLLDEIKTDEGEIFDISLKDLLQIDFWYKANKPGQFSDIMISSRHEPLLLHLLKKNEIPFNITISDVEELIIQKEKQKGENDIRIRMKRERLSHQEFEIIGKTRAEFSFGDYSSYASMIRYLRTLEFYYPKIVRLIRIGMSHEGRPIEGVKIGFHVSNTTKRAVWIDGNIHAREWASSHTALFIINQLVAGYGVDRTITDYLNNLNFYIVPCLNPDGYEHSRSSVLPQIRLWRKNRSPERCMPTQWGGIRCCQGVDLNRNFDFHWAETGSSDNPCSNLYAGEYAFSEPESHSVAMFLQSNNLRGKLDVFITLHTYAQFFIHPYSHMRRTYPVDVDDILETAKKATRRLKQIYGTEYQVGTGADLLSPAAGGSDDWAKDILGVKYVYLLELRPQNNMKNGFILDRSELLPVGVETLEALKVIFDSVVKSNTSAPFHNDALNIPVNNTLDIRKLSSAITQTPLSYTPPPTQAPRWHTMYIPRTNFYTTLSTTAKTTSTTTNSFTDFGKAVTVSTRNITIATLSPLTTGQSTSFITPLPTTKGLKTVISTPQLLTTIEPTLPSTSEARSDTIELIRNLPFETRKQLSEELLKKQLMRIKNLVMTTATAPSVGSNTITHNNTVVMMSRFTSSSSRTKLTKQITNTTPISTTLKPTGNCGDKKYSCGFWINADKKACRTQRQFMETNCALSCGYCNVH